MHVSKRVYEVTCLEHVCYMLLSLDFPVTRNPSRAVTLPNIGLPQYIGVPHRVTYPYTFPPCPSSLASTFPLFKLTTRVSLPAQTASLRLEPSTPRCSGTWFRVESCIFRV